MRTLRARSRCTRSGEMLSSDEVRSYQKNGFLTVEGIVPMPLVEEARQVVEEFVDRSRQFSDHDSVYDLEPGHSAAEPRVRRLKEPCALHPIFDRINRLPLLLDIVEALIGP